MKFTTFLIALPYFHLVIAGPGPMDSAAKRVSTPTEPVVTWAIEHTYRTRPEEKDEWEKLVCEALRKDGCSHGTILNAEHYGPNAGWEIPHVTVYTDDGKMMHAFKDGSYDVQPPTRPFVPVDLRKDHKFNNMRLREAYRKVALEITAGDPTGKTGYAKMMVGKVPVPYAVPFEWVAKKHKKKKKWWLEEGPSPLAEPFRDRWRALNEQNQPVALGAAGEGTSKGAWGAQGMMVGSMEVPLIPHEGAGTGSSSSGR